MKFLHFALSAAVLAGASALVFSPAASPSLDDQPELRLGYFANVTHATAIVGVEQGLIAKELGEKAELKTFTFNAGPSAIEALLSGALDASYIGPNPAINAYVKSKGQALRIISGATSGGAFLVVDPAITKVEELKGKKIASPQLGNTQDVALRAWLKDQGYKIALTGESDVTILPQENAQTLEAFKQRQIAGAWVPEPWATRLILEGGGKVLVDECDLWPEKRFVTTHLIVSSEFLKKSPELVSALLRGHLAAEKWLLEHTPEAQTVVNDGIAKITGKKIADATIQGAWKNLEFTHDPVASSLAKSARDAQAAGLLNLEGVDLSGIYDLTLLNAELKHAKLPLVKSGSGGQ